MNTLIKNCNLNLQALIYILLNFTYLCSGSISSCASLTVRINVRHFRRKMKSRTTTFKGYCLLLWLTRTSFANKICSMFQIVWDILFIHKMISEKDTWSEVGHYILHKNPHRGDFFTFYYFKHQDSVQFSHLLAACSYTKCVWKFRFYIQKREKKTICPPGVVFLDIDMIFGVRITINKGHFFK